MNPRSLESALNRALLLWPERVGEGRLQLDPLKLTRPTESFYRLVWQECHGVADEDIELALVNYLQDSPTLAHWYADVMRLEDVRVDWTDQEPRIRTDGASRWTRLCDTLDQDVLLAYDFASKYRKRTSVEGCLANWRTVARCTDFDLSRMLAGGVADLHVHVGGVRIPQQVWLELVSRPESAFRYDKLPQSLGRSSRDFARWMREVVDVREHLTRALGVEANRRPPDAPRGRWWSWSSQSMAGERALLIDAWRVTLTGASQRVSSLLDRYCLAKHEFAAASRQQAFAAKPGLRRFEHVHFPKLKRSAPRPPLQDTAAFRSSGRQSMRQVADACSYLFESRCLRRIELRIAPFERVEEYLRFFKLWEGLRGQFAKWFNAEGTGALPEVRFAVHFKRTRHAGGSLRRPVPMQQMLRSLDHQSAALRAALACSGSRRQPLLISRIDVAGNERDLAVGHFAAHLKLLRGDPSAVAGLERLCDDQSAPVRLRQAFAAWQRLRRRQLHEQTAADRPLGLTIHAGEDFADPLDGLFQVATAMEQCGMRSGDAIGHGLVLAHACWSERLWCANLAYLRAGPHLQSMCWLHGYLQARLPAAFRTFRDALEREILKVGRRVFPDHDGGGGVEALLAVCRAWLDPLKREARPHESTALAMWRHSQSGDTKFDNQIESIVKTDRRVDFEAPLQEVAKDLLSRLIKERIVVEMNPSSNIRISGASSAQKSPTVSIFQCVADGLLACINTDDPGVFATCVENEFAILLESSRSTISERDLRELLDRVRRTGLEQVNWR